MGILNRLLSWGFGQPDYSDSDTLRAIWGTYSDQWPDNNDRYKGWKPASVLPAPKWAIKRAMKLCYAEWPEPIDWTIFNAFFMEFADLGQHLRQEEYDAIENFRSGRIKYCGRENKHDPLLDFRLCAVLASCTTIEQSNQSIVRVRDGLRRSVVWDTIDADDHELDLVRRILLESATEFSALIEEWRFYILSIGRDQFIEDS